MPMFLILLLDDRMAASSHSDDWHCMCVWGGVAAIVIVAVELV